MASRMHASLVAVTYAAVTLPLFAADSSLPVYPNAGSRLHGMPSGSGLSQYETTDSTEKVDAWYGAHLPKACKHETAQGGAKYACPGTNIMITPDKGMTVITHMASWVGGH